MSAEKKIVIDVKGSAITILSKGKEDYVSLTDIAKSKNTSEPFAIINNWMRSRSTIEFIGLWERLCNSNFKPLEFERFKIEAGSNYFVLSPQKWIESTNAIGIISKSGRYGGTFAHKDIAFEFASWISSEFKLYLIVEFQRLKEEETKRLSLEWDLHRTLAKINYRIHTDSIKENIIPPEITKEQSAKIYADEADLLNVAMFGKTAGEWRQDNSEKKGNIRDYSTLEQLLVLANLESLNAEFLRMKLSQKERLKRLNNTAIIQLKSLLESSHVKKLKPKA